MLGNDKPLTGGFNTDSPHAPREFLDIFFYAVFTSSLFIFLIYWFFYLYINVQTRLHSSLGFSDFPFLPSAPMYLYSIGISGEWPFWVLYIAFFLTLIHSVIYNIFKYKGKKPFSKISLLLPTLYPILFVIYSSFALITSCSGEECGLGGLVTFLVTFIVIGFALSIVTITILASLFVKVVERRKIVLYLFTFIFLLSIFSPIFLPKLFFKTGTARITSANKIKISRIDLKKVATNLDWTKMSIVFFDNHDEDFQKRTSGNVVLTKLNGGRLLVQEKVKVGSDGVPRADLFVEDNGKLTNITEGLKFLALYAAPSAVSTEYSSLYFNGPLLYSLTKDKLAFEQSGTLAVIKLDGSGILVDDQFCNGMVKQVKVPAGKDTYTCSVSWDSKGNFFGLVDFGSFIKNEGVVFKIAIPKF